MPIKYYPELIQGSEEWKAARCGILTASEMKNVVSKKTSKGFITYQPFDDYANATHTWELLSQRITGYVEPKYISDDMLRGHEDEVYMREAYAKKYSPVEEIGFITNDKWGFTLGYSPDGLINNRKAAIEGKSRRQKYQIETIIMDEVPEEYKIQLQTGMLVAELDYIDFNSYCGGMYMTTIRVMPDTVMQGVILTSAQKFEDKIKSLRAIYEERAASGDRLVMTERVIEEEMTI